MKQHAPTNRWMLPKGGERIIVLEKSKKKKNTLQLICILFVYVPLYKFKG